MSAAWANAVPTPKQAGLALTFGMLLGSCLPAAAQSHFFPGRSATAAIPILSARFETSLPLSGPTHSENLLRLAPLDSQGHNHSSALESSIDYVETPFAQETRLPVAALWGGRLKLGGFDKLSPMENMLLGPPASGRLPAWSVTTQAHPGLWVPLAEESYGLRLAVHLKRDSQPGPHTQVWRCLARVVGAGRGCHLD
jgi:hypothetical protein